MLSTDRPVMLTDQYGPRSYLEAISHLEAMHAHQLAQSAQKMKDQAWQIARLRQDLASARDEIARLKGMAVKGGAYLHNSPQDETP